MDVVCERSREIAASPMAEGSKQPLRVVAAKKRSRISKYGVEKRGVDAHNNIWYGIHRNAIVINVLQSSARSTYVL